MVNRVPDLLRVALIIGHFKTWHRVGQLVLYEPKVVPIGALGGIHPSSIELNFSRYLEDYMNQFLLDWKLPTVEVLVIGFKAKDGPFCISQPVARVQYYSSEGDFEAL